MIEQLSVFIENTPGRADALFKALADAGVNVRAFTLADTADFGVARLLCDKPERTREALAKAGFRATLTKTSAVRVPDEPGGLSRLLSFVTGHGVDVQYAYCYQSKDNTAIDVMRTADAEALEGLLEEGGFDVVDAKEVYELD